MAPISISEFSDRLSEIIPVLMKEFARQNPKELYKTKITLPQLLILNLLNIQGESSMSDMARAMSVTTAAMTGLIDRLVKSGYVLRSIEPRDRRVIKVKLTSKGTGLVKKVNEQRREMIINIFGKISQKERDDYLRILTRIRDVLHKEKTGAK